MSRRPTPSGWRFFDADIVTRAIVLALALAASGCSGLFSSDSTPRVAPTPDISAAVRALRVRVLDDMAFVAEGDTDPRLNERVKDAVQAELGHAGLTVIRGQDGTPDVDIRLEIRVSAAVYFLHGHVALTAESGGVAVAIAATPDEFHRDGEFPPVMAQKAVQALLHSPGLAEFAEKKNPRPVVVRQEPRPAPVDERVRCPRAWLVDDPGKADPAIVQRHFVEPCVEAAGRSHQVFLSSFPCVRATVVAPHTDRAAVAAGFPVGEVRRLV